MRIIWISFNTLVNIIIMLKRTIRTALPLFARTQLRTLLCARPVFGFSQMQNYSAGNFKNLLTSEINEEEKNTSDLTEYVNYFQNQGWTVNYDGIQI